MKQENENYKGKKASIKLFMQKEHEEVYELSFMPLFSPSPLSGYVHYENRRHGEKHRHLGNLCPLTDISTLLLLEIIRHCLDPEKLNLT